MARRGRRAAMRRPTTMRARDEVGRKMHAREVRWRFAIHVKALGRLACVTLAGIGLIAVSPPSGAQPATSDGRIVLPDDVIPAHYEVEVTPDVAHLAFSGRARIDIDVRRQTRRIELNAADLAFE